MDPDQTVRQAMIRLLHSDGASPRSVTTRVAGAPLHHLEQGTGQPVVLFHGGTGGGANWFRLFPRLAGECRVLAPDLPGFGLSAPARPRAPLGALAADTLAAWLDAVGVTGAVVAGTSFGGLAALRLAQRAPERVAGLFLLDSAGLGRDLHPLVRLAALPGLTAIGMKPTRRGTAAMFRRLLTTNRGLLSDEQVAALTEFLYLTAARAGTSYLAQTLRLFASPRGQREVLSPAELAALPQSVTIAWGALDPFLPADHGRAAARHCRDARLVVIPNAGHSPNWETPDPVAAALIDLARRVARRPRASPAN
jgi:pimeloyl-ACP methyl ester carboxylesterase